MEGSSRCRCFESIGTSACLRLRKKFFEERQSIRREAVLGSLHRPPETNGTCEFHDLGREALDGDAAFIAGRLADLDASFESIPAHLSFAGAAAVVVGNLHVYEALADGSQ